MPRGIVLLKRKIRELSQDLVHNWDNNPRIRTLIYALLILLPKEPPMPLILPTYTPLKHLSNLLLVLGLYAILVIHLLLSNLASCLDPHIPSKLYPCLVALED